MPFAVLCPLLAFAALLEAGSVQVYPGETGAQVPVRVAADAGEEVAAVTVTIEYDDVAAILTDAAAGPAAESAGKTVTLNMVDGHSARLVVAGLNQTPIPDGTLVYLIFDVSVFAQPGAHEVALSEAALSDPFGQPLFVEVMSGALVVSDAFEGEVAEGEDGEGETPLPGGCQCAGAKAGAQQLLDVLGDLLVGLLALAGMAVLHARCGQP